MQVLQAPRAGGPDPLARPAPNFQARVGRRRLTDRLTRGFVRLGGTAVIASILAILVVIVLETLPLFRKASASLDRSPDLPAVGTPLAVGTDEYREFVYLVTERGVQVFAADGTAQKMSSLSGLEGATIAGVSDRGRGALALGLSDGRILPVQVRFEVSFEQGKRVNRPGVGTSKAFVIDPAGGQIRVLGHAGGESETSFVAATGPRKLALLRVKKKAALIGGEKLEETRAEVSLDTGGEITALAVDGRGEDVFVGTSRGSVVRVDWRDAELPKQAETVSVARGGSAVSVLGQLIGDRTLVVGDAAGGVTSLQVLRQGGGEFSLVRVHDFDGHASAVAGFSASQRNKGFLTVDAAGEVRLFYGTTGERLLSIGGDGAAARRVALPPKANGIVAAGPGGKSWSWSLNNPHPEVTARSLFGSLWYEGYERADLVWQSTGGTDDFESKFSLSPLVYGTLKGTFYALLIAVPVALLSALYVSQFMHPRLKAQVKPAIEVMAALPSVVLGFIAGLWLAPRVEKVMPGLFLAPLVIAAAVLVALAGWRRVPRRWRQVMKPGTEVAILVPVVLLATWVALGIGNLVEATLLGGDYRGWLLRTLGLTYDQRNSVVVGFAMGFAVIPIIFTIAEDSLSNVPPHLTAGSLALGATRWQTAVRVVLPTASPGIFSAVMIGFGRAVGETMIVLMATGNTPVMDASPFNGFRALSANIAVELPEASAGSTHFRILFLAAFLLFVMTFIVNTAAEVVRIRLRKRYQGL